MKVDLKLQGFEEVIKRFANDYGKRYSQGAVTVGYTAAYAAYVHEMVDANFQRPGAQAKFLEQPFRERHKEWVGLAGKALEKGATMEHALYIAGLALQRASQELCPIDTGNLRASAFTRKDSKDATPA